MGVDPPHQGEGGEQPPSRGLEVSLVLTPGRAPKLRAEMARHIEHRILKALKRCYHVVKMVCRETITDSSSKSQTSQEFILIQILQSGYKANILRKT